jgi:hypothetical protein
MLRAVLAARCSSKDPAVRSMSRVIIRKDFAAWGC